MSAEAKRAAIEAGDHDELRRLALELPEGTKWVTFNNGATHWAYKELEELAEIMAFVNQKVSESPFNAQYMVMKTLEAERKMFQKLS